MSNKNNTTIYVGVTNDLKKRIYEHKNKMVKGFTQKYNISKLVYFEILADSYNAISREKQIKGGSRKKKTDLINKNNSKWNDLYEDL